MVQRKNFSGRLRRAVTFVRVTHMFWGGADPGNSFISFKYWKMAFNVCIQCWSEAWGPVIVIGINF